MSTSQNPTIAGGGVGPGAQGGQPWQAGKYVARTYFCYESDTASSLAAAAAQNLTFNIAGDSDFFWTKFTAYAQATSSSTTYAAQQLPSVTLLLINTTTGRQYMSSAVPLANMAGTAQFPFILPMITLWPMKSTIQLQLTNNGSTTYTQLQLSFHGIKAFV
jgi:hypothetical protein